MYRVKQLFGGHLTLRDYDAQVGEAIAMIRALNKMTRAGSHNTPEAMIEWTHWKNKSGTALRGAE